MAHKKKNNFVAPQTYEEHLEFERESFFLCHNNYGIIPPVNYFYSVGEEIKCGNLKDCRVEEVLEDGKIILLSYHDKGGETNGKPYDNGRKPKFVMWHDISPLKTICDTKFVHRESMRSKLLATRLDAFTMTCYHRGLIDSPEYQRDYVWTLDDKRRLVQSIFDRSDIGKFVTMSHPWPENRIEVIDGKQRLKAIMEFREGRFDFQGYTWFQLSNKDKYGFNDNMLQIIELDSKYVKKSEVLWLFLSINRGGVPQTEEHIAHVKKLYHEALIAEA